MTLPRALIGFVGQGTGGGVKVRVEPYPGLAEPDRKSQVHARLEQDWALAADAYTSARTPLGFTLKLSRHRAADSSDWIWIALYQTARFSEDQRGGLYSGTGILLDALPDPGGAVSVINTLFQFERTLFRGDLMVGHLADLDISGLRLPQLATIAGLTREGGLDPRSSDGCLFPGHDVSAQDTFIRDIQETFFGSRYAHYSAVYFCEDPMGGSPRQFHSAGDVPAAPPPAAAFHPAAFGGDRAEQISFAVNRHSSVGLETLEPDILRKLRIIDQRTMAIESHLRALQDAGAAVSPAQSGGVNGKSARRAAIMLAIIAVLALVGWGGSKLWNRFFRADPVELATTAQTGQKDGGADSGGPQIVVKETDITVVDRQPVRLTAEVAARGTDSAITSVVLRDGPQVVASGYRAGLHAQGTGTLQKAGDHHLVIECEARRAVIEDCLVTPAATAEAGPTAPTGRGTF